MGKIKLFFTFNNDLFLLNEDNSYLKLTNGRFANPGDTGLPKLSPKSKIFLYDNKLIQVEASSLTAYSLVDTCSVAFQQNFDTEIDLFDTSRIRNFVALYFVDASCITIDLTNQSQVTKHASSGLVFGTNGKYILEYDIAQRNKIIFKEGDIHKEIIFDECHIDPVTAKPNKTCIERAHLYDTDGYVLHSKYDYLYDLKISNGDISVKQVALKNTFLGDTAYLQGACFHVTAKFIYRLNWDSGEGHPLLNWTEAMGSNFQGTGIRALQAFDETLVFADTKHGLVIFYSVVMNKITKHISLNKPFYMDAQSTIYKNEMMVNDVEGHIHRIPLP